MKSPSNYALRLPLSLKKEAERIAKADGTSLNQFVVSAVGEKISALRTADYFNRRAAKADLAAFDAIMMRRGAQGGEVPGDEVG